MITAQDLRNQAKAHREAAEKLEAAADTMDAFGVAAPVPIVAPPRGFGDVEITARKRVRPPGLVVSAGVKKNQDLCFEVLKQVGKPMGLKELMKAIQDKGSLITNTNTITYYLRNDEQKRFTRPSDGVWALAQTSKQP